MGARSPEIEIELAGTLTVSYRIVEGEWHCKALQFDILGTGDTRDKAREEMLELTKSYLFHALTTPHPFRFFNPADSEEWNLTDREDYRIVVKMIDAHNDRPVNRGNVQYEELLRRTGKPASVDLVPA